MSINLSDEDVNAILDIDHPSDDTLLGLGFDARCECLQIMAACGAGNISRGLATDYLVKAFAREFPTDVGRPILTRSINEFLASLRPLQATLKAEMPAAVERGPSTTTMQRAFEAAGYKPDDRIIMPTDELKVGDVVAAVDWPDAEPNDTAQNAAMSGTHCKVITLTQTVISGGLYVGMTIMPLPPTHAGHIGSNFAGWRWHVIERKSR